VLSFKASLYFWMRPMSGSTFSCHDAMVGNTSPSGFGAVTNIVNGGVLQCGNGNPVRSDAENVKIKYFQTYEAAFGLTPTPAADATCKGMSPFGR
jgi:hypothetical protein